MAWDEIKFKISADMDFKDAKSQIDGIKSGIEGIKTSIADMPNASRILNSSLEKTETIAESIGQKLSRLESGRFRNDEERKQLETSIGNDISELNVLRNLQTGSGDFSTALASSWFGNLPNAVQRELDSVIPKVSNIIRTRTSSLNAENRIKGVTSHAIAQQLMADKEIKAVQAQLKSAEAQWHFDSLLERLVPNVVAKNRLDSYQLARYGSFIQNERVALSKGDVIDLFPESFKAAYRNKGYTKRNFTGDAASYVLAPESVKELNNMLASRPIMAKAAIASGISRRDSRGVMETKQEISRAEWENYREALYDELIDRIAGYGKSKIDPYTRDKKSVEKLESRLTSSTSGDTMLAMHDIEKYEQENAWSTGSGSNRWTKLPGEGRRAINQYVVTKYSPFLTRADGQKLAPQEVMIADSHNTRLLGQGKWKNNDDVSDTVALISLAGYNKDDKTHEAALLDLYRNGKVINGKKYIAQSTHGKGEDQVVRMIEESAYRRVEAEETEFARKHGIPGTYWNNFNDAEIQRKIANGTITAQDWGKHLEAKNKAWTPTADVGLDLSKKRIAVVDFAGMGDGATWVSSNMMQDSGQIRLGVSGKGSAFVFGGKNVGDFARKSGLADKDGRIMMRGPDGQMYDVSDYDMIMPMDVIKNKGAYMNADGTFKSGEEASKIATALGQRYGIGMLANYSKEDTTADNLGTQMSSFIQFSPAIRDQQIKMAMHRLEELDTEAGQLKYVFGDQGDWLSRKVNEDTQLLNTEAAKKRVDAHRQSLIQDLIAGRYIDFGNDGGISNMRLAANPLASYLLSHGGITPEVIAKARGYIEEDAKKRGIAIPNYTDKEIENMLIPDENTVLDFEHKDQDWLGVIRSPTGYGNMLHVRNVAREAEPIYRGMGIATNAGIYISEKQRDVLQGADFDSDQAKVVYNEQLRKDIEASVENQKYEKAEIESQPVQYTPEELADAATQEAYRAGRASVMGLGMGTGSSGIRIMQLDLSKPQNRKFIQQAQRLSAYYDNRTVDDKNPTIVNFDDVNAWETLGLGKEYTKFSDKASDLFRFEDDLLDSDGNADTNLSNDVFKASNGRVVNLRRLRDMGVDNINLPASFMANHLMGVAEIGALYKNGAVDTSQMDAIAEAMDAMGYGDAGPARQKLMRTMRQMLTQFGTGERTRITDPESRSIQAMVDAAEAELTVDADKYLNPETGQYDFNGKHYKTKDAFVAARSSAYGIKTASNAIRGFGMTDQRLRALFGDEYVEQRFSNLPTATIELLPEDKEELEYQRKADELSAKIEESQTKVDNERASRKKRSKSQRKKQLAEEKKELNEITALEKDAIQKENEAQELRSKYDLAVSEAVRNEHENPTDEYSKDAKPEDYYMAGGIQRSEVEELESVAAKARAKANAAKEKYESKYGKLTGTPKGELISDEEKNLNALLQEKEQLDKDRELNQKAIDMRSEYQALLSDARDYNDKIWGFQKGKENKINDSKTFAQKYYWRSYYQGQEQLAPLDAFSEKLDTSGLPKETINEMKTGLAAVRNNINENIQKDFTNNAILYAKNLSDEIEKELNKEENAPTKQKQKLDAFDKEIENSKSFVDFMQNQLEYGHVDPAHQKLYEDAIKDTNKYLAKIESDRAKLRNVYTKENEAAGRQAIENLEIQFGVRDKNSYAVRSESRLRTIKKERDQITKEHNEGLYSEDEFNKAISALDALEKKSSTTSLAIQDMGKAAISGITSPIKMMANQFERQLMQSAIKEVRQFVTDFNKSMTEIQMITLKSDTQIQSLGTNLINKAKEMKVSVSEVTQSAATLYRQGLSDQEVDERLDVISKFSKVSGTKVDAATKLITVAMNTGLISDPGTAADIVTALGDSAATNASEIEKGIEKAGAAAAADGTTFGELAAMLTAITSTTQIGGNVAGRTINTIMGRMNKIGTNELIYDENGNAVSGSAVAKLLEAQGISMYDESGNKQSTFKTLYSLSQKWEGMSDAEQQQIANAIAGTRQYSNFAAIMQGMAEGDIDKYMDLIGESSGIVDKKYEVYTKSLEASLNELRSTFDGLVADMTDSGALTGFVGMITSAIQGVDNLTKGVGGLGAALIPVLMMMAGLGIMKTGGLPGILAGGALAIGGFAIANLAGNKQETAAERYSELNNASLDKYNSWNSKIEKARELNSKTDRTEQEQAQLDSLVTELSSFADAGAMADEAAKSADNLAGSLVNLSASADNTTSIINAADATNKKERARAIYTGAADQAEAMADAYNTEATAFIENGNTAWENLKGRLFTVDEEGNISHLLGNDSIAFGEAFHGLSDEARRSFARSIMGMRENINGEAGDEIRRLYNELGAKGFEEHMSRFGAEYLWNFKDLGIFDQYLNFLQLQSGSSESIKDFSRSTATNLFSQYFADKVPADMLAGLAAEGANQLIESVTDSNGNIGEITSEAFSKVINSLLGFDTDRKDRFTYDSIQTHLEEAAKRGASRNRPEWMKQIDLEDAGVGGYYIDETNNQVLSAEEAEKQVNDYNRLVEERNRQNEAIRAKNAEAIRNAEIENKNLLNRLGEAALSEYNAGVPQRKKEYDKKYNNLLSENAYVVLDESRRIIDTASTHEKADEIANSYLMYYNKKTGEKYGINEAGLQKYEEAKERELNNPENYEYFVDGQSVGKGTAAKEEALGKWSFRDHKGELVLYDDYQDALADLESERAIVQQKIDNDFNRYWSNPMNRPSNPEDVEKAQEYWMSRAAADNRIYSDRISDQVNSVEEVDSSFIGELPELEGYTAYVSYINDVIDEIKKVRPEFDYSPEEVLSGWEQLPDEIQEAIRKAAEAGEVTAEIIQEITDAIPKPQFKSVKNYFQAGVETGAAAWDQKNSLAVTADKMYRMIQNASQIQDVQSLFNYVNEHGIREWSALNANEDFAHLMKQYRFDEHGKQIGGPTDIAPIVSMIMGMGQDYGNEALTAKEAGQRAKTAIEALKNGSYVSLEAAEQANLAAYEQEVELIRSQLEAGYGQNLKREEIDTKVNELLKSEGIDTFDKYITQYGGAKGLDDKQRSYIKSILGEGLEQRLYTQGYNNLRPEEKRVIDNLATNASYGVSGLTTRQKYEGARDIYDRIRSGQSIADYSDIAAEQYMSGFSNWGTYRMLKEQQQAGTISDEDLKLLEQYDVALDNFIKNSQIQLEVEGLQELEAAGELLEGTAKLVEQLSKGGEFAIKARLEIQSNLFDEAQLDAMLNSGNAQIQAEAAQKILGISSDLYNTNAAGFNAQARGYRESRRKTTASSLMKEYLAAKTPEEQQAFLDSLQGTGWSLGALPGYVRPDGQYVDPAKVFTYRPQDYVFSNPYVGAEKNYTDAELYRMRQRILSGEMGTTEEGYETALKSGGQEWQEYQRLTTNRDTEIQLAAEARDKALEAAGADEEARVAAEEAYNNRIKSLDKDIENAKARADKEEELTAQDVLDVETLNNLRLESGTASGAYLYAQEAYRQNNKSALAADSLYQSLTDGSINNFKDFANLVTGQQVDNWSELLRTAPELADELDKLGVKFDESGNINVEETEAALQEAGIDIASVLESIAALIAGKSANFTDGNYNTRSDIYRSAQEYLAGSKEEGDKTAFSQIVGSDLAARYAADDYELTKAEQDYIQMLIDNFRNGIIGLTEKQRLAGANQLFDAALNGDYSQYLDQSQDMISAYTSDFQGLNDYLADTAKIEEAVKQGKTLAEAYEYAGITAEEYGKKQKNVNAVLSATAVEMSNLSDATKENASAILEYAKGGKAAAQQLMKDKDSLKGWQDQLLAANNSKGKSGKQVAKGKEAKYWMEYLGLPDKKALKEALKDYSADDMDVLAENMAKDAQTNFNEKLGSLVQAGVGDINKALDLGTITMDAIADIVVNPETGEIDFSKFAELLAQIGSEYAAIAQEYAGLIAEYFISIIQHKDKDGGSVEVVGSTGSMKTPSAHTGRSSGGGGGGGGGNKDTHIKDMLNRQKYEVGKVTHDIDLKQAEQTRRDYANDYHGYFTALDEEIMLQEKLYGVYSKNLAELQAQLGSLEEYSDDWYDVSNAIQDAEKALAEIGNTIDAIQAKKLGSLLRRNEEYDAPVEHEKNMYSLQADLYSDLGQPTNSNAFRYQSLLYAGRQIFENNNHIYDLQALMAMMKEGDSTWVSARQEMWKKIEENKQLEKEYVEGVAQIEEANIDTLMTNLEHIQMPTAYGKTQTEYLSKEAQRAGDGASYRGILLAQNELLKKDYEDTSSAAANLEAYMSTLDFGTDRYYKAAQNLNDLKTKLLEIGDAIQENNTEITQSKIDDLVQKYTDLANALKNISTYYSVIGNLAGDTMNYGAQQSALKNSRAILSVEQGYKLSEMNELLQLLDETTEAPKRRAIIEDYQKVYDELANSYKTDWDLQKQIQQSYYDEINTPYEREKAVSSRDLSVAKASAQLYARNEEFENAILSDEKQIEIVSGNIQKRTEIVQKLQNLLESGDITDPKLADNLAKQIYSLQTETANDKVTIQNLTAEAAKNKINSTQLKYTDLNNLTRDEKTYLSGLSSIAGETMNYEEQRNAIQGLLSLSEENRANKISEMDDWAELLKTETNPTRQREIKDKYSAAYSQVVSSYTKDIQNQRKLEQSYLDEINTPYQRETAVENRNLSVEKTNAQLFASNEEFDQVIASDQKQIEIIERGMKTKADTIQQLQNLLESGQITDSKLADSIAKQIYNLQTGVANDKVTLQSMDAEISKNKINSVQLKYTDLNNQNRDKKTYLSGISNVAEETMNYEEQRSALQEILSLSAADRERNINEMNEWAELLKTETNPTRQREIKDKYSAAYSQLISSQTNDIQNQRKLEQSYVDEINTPYQRESQVRSRDESIAAINTQLYIANDEWANSRNSLQNEVDLLEDDIRAEKENVKKMQDLLDSGQITDPKIAETLAQNIYAGETKIANSLLEVQKKRSEITRNLINELKQILQDTQTVYNGIADQLNSQLQLDQYDNNYAGQREDYVKMNAALDEKTEADREAFQYYIDNMKKEMTPEEYRAAEIEFYEAQNTLNQDLVQKRTNQENIERNLVDELQHQFSDEDMDIQHYQNMMEIQRRKYESVGDTESANAITDQMIEYNKGLIETYSGRIEQIRETMEHLDPDGESYRKLKELLINYTEKQASLVTDNVNAENEKANSLIEQLDFAESNRTHILNLLQTQKEGYKNTSELTNYGKMLQKENEIIRKNIAERAKEIEQLKQQAAAATSGSDAQKALERAIMSREEATARDTVTLEENTRALLENQISALSLRTRMEDLINQEYEIRESDRKSLVQSRSSVAQSIYEVLKKEKEDEWALLNKDIEKQKEALEEEKNLLTMRLNLRKNARSKENQERELAEYQYQLSRIAADPTRSKDASELRRKIQELQEELSDTEAEERVNAAQERIEDQITALSDFQTYYGEQLEKFLENANNFQKEIQTIISSGMNGWIDWMKEHNQEYLNSSIEMQKQLVESWQGTWEGSHTYKNYYDYADDILATRESWLEFIKTTHEYMNASVTQQQKMLLEYGQWYDDYIASMKNDATFEHDDHVAGNNNTDNGANWGYEGLDLPEGTQLEDVVLSALKFSDFVEKLVESVDPLVFNDNYTELIDSLKDAADIITDLIKPEDLEAPDATPVDPSEYSDNYTELINALNGASDLLSLLTKPEDLEAPDAEKVDPSAFDDNYTELIATLTNTNSLLDLIPKPEDLAIYTEPFKDYSKTINDMLTTVGEASAQIYRDIEARAKADQEALSKFATNLEAGLMNGVGLPIKDYIGPETTAIESNTGSTGSNTTSVDKNTDAVKKNTKQSKDTQTETKDVGKQFVNEGINIENVSKQGVSELKDINKTLKDTLTDLVKDITSKDNRTTGTDKNKTNPSLATTNKELNTLEYATGGYVDYTGYAWVDGTPTKPESFLDATDTKLLRSMLDSYNEIRTVPMMVPSSQNFGNNTSVGDINITINQAEMSTDADINKVARQIGTVFVKEISKSGLRLDRLSF